MVLNAYPAPVGMCHVFLILPSVNCSDPTPPVDGSIEPYQNTTEGAEIFFRCNLGFVPAGRMRTVCGADGRWNPDTATVCTCEYHINLLYIQSVALCSVIKLRTISLSVIKYLIIRYMYLAHKIDDWICIYIVFTGD